MQIDVYFMFSYNPELNAMFVLLYLFHLQAGSILKRSPEKNELSEPGRHKDRSHEFFIDPEILGSSNIK